MATRSRWRRMPGPQIIAMVPNRYGTAVTNPVCAWRSERLHDLRQPEPHAVKSADKSEIDQAQPQHLGRSQAGQREVLSCLFGAVSLSSFDDSQAFCSAVNHAAFEGRS